MLRCAVMMWILVVAPRLLADERPNILLILVDDLGYGDLSSYGATDMETPAIDRLMASGLRFDNFYANCPVCSPTRASLLTGRYPDLVGVPGVIRTHTHNSWGYLSPEVPLLPELLRQADYDTALVGKWHLGLDEDSQPNRRGFDFFHGFLGDMMDDYYHHRRHDRNYMRRNRTEIDPDGHASELFTQWAIDYLDTRDRSRPFFLYLAYNAPHTPIQPPPDVLAEVRARDANLDPARARLVALIEHLDDGIGRVLDKLDDADLTNNTLVIFSSDNGGQVNVKARNGPLRAGKGTMYEGGLKVPTCVVWPDKISAGRSTQAAATMDLFPTICEAARVDVQHPIDGVSLMDILLSKREQLPDRDLFFVRREGGDQFGGLTTRALRRANWKLVQNSPFAPMQLFDLHQDPLETTDLAPVKRETFRQLSAAMRVQVQRAGAVPWQTPSRRDD